jgi:hypothetical protein
MTETNPNPEKPTKSETMKNKINTPQTKQKRGSQKRRRRN